MNLLARGGDHVAVTSRIRCERTYESRARTVNAASSSGAAEADILGNSSTVEIARLRTGPAIRADGVDEDHVAVLADMLDDLPPIVVHRPSMRVVDGLHRVRAAQSQRRRHIVAGFVG